MHRATITGLALGLAVALGACQDAPTELESGPFTESAFAKGGNKGGGSGPPDADVVSLGQHLFADEALSLNGNQSCQTCHHPDEGFAAPLPGTPTMGAVVQGSVAGQFGDRKPPTAAYATLMPFFGTSGQNASGGSFWDGRATGEVLGSPAADQALGPFLNPKEQAMPDEACVVWEVSRSAYAPDFESVWGLDWSQFGFGGYDMDALCEPPVTQSWDPDPLSAAHRQRVHDAYHDIARSIAAFEASLNVFDSRFDRGELSPLEQEGEQLFSSKGKCHQCHDTKGSQPLFTDFEFHNLGVPAHPDYTAYPGSFDPGLGGHTGESGHMGKFKTPTVRNVGVGSNRSFMHNGAIPTLRQVVQFYSTRDVLPTCSPAQDDPFLWGPDGYGCWPAPEYGDNLDTKNMGNLGLTDHEVDAIVAFMLALSDAGL